jgi:single-strand DNA-binding protein
MAYNKTILQGNLTRDVEIRYAQAGTAIGNTGIAVSHKYKTKAGEQKEETLFIDIVAFGRTAEIMNQYVRKGSKVLVDGRLKLEQWEDKNGGGKRSKHTLQIENFQMLDSKQDGQQQGQPQQGQQQYQGYQQQQPQQPQQQQQAAPPYNPPPAQGQQQIPVVDVDQEIPF